MGERAERGERGMGGKGKREVKGSRVPPLLQYPTLTSDPHFQNPGSVTGCMVAFIVMATRCTLFSSHLEYWLTPVTRMHLEGLRMPRSLPLQLSRWLLGQSRLHWVIYCRPTIISATAVAVIADRTDWVTEQFLNGTSAQYRLRSAILIKLHSN